MAATVVETVDPLVCRCLQVRQSTVSDCVQLYGAESLQDVRSQCGAGGGCNSCHRKIRDFIAAHRARAEQA
ncbi:MAG: (2Fe-2S)-binding protein [Planctomycetaceae bacterium]